MKRYKNNSRRIKRLERKTVSGSTVVNAFLGSSSGTGVSSFIELSDTPTEYDSLKILRANTGETAVEHLEPETTGVISSTFTANSGTAVNDASTFDGYTIGQVVKALRNLKILT